VFRPEPGIICLLTANRPGLRLTRAPVLVLKMTREPLLFRVKCLDERLVPVGKPVWIWELFPMTPLFQLAWIDCFDIFDF